MFRAIVVRGMLCLAALFVAAPALAQSRIEIEAGVNYPLISDNFEVTQNPGLHLRVRYGVTPRLQIGVAYDVLATNGDLRPLKFQFVDTVPAYDELLGVTDAPVRDLLNNGGDVDVTLYGLTGSIVLVGEPELQLLLVGSAGVGELEFDNPGRSIALPFKPDDDFDGTPDGQYTFSEVFLSDREDDSDIKLWYELGAAVRFTFGDHWGFRITATYRRLDPDGQNTVLPVGVSEIVPQFGAIYRF
ncbi:MAG: outer membrane beta-barrel protein [Acidobacteria bacterium]|nr:outer membrane beta-barrel protein [Acidobacteriota bacterium]